ncbi:hypothetical protein ABIF74_011820 [Bradyrhizobium japonicum]
MPTAAGPGLPVLQKVAGSADRPLIYAELEDIATSW